MHSSQYDNQNPKVPQYRMPQYKLRKRDFSNIREWFDRCLANYSPHENGQLGKNREGSLQKHYFYRFIIQEIILNQEFVLKNYAHLSNCLSNGLSLFACVYSQSEGVYIGRPYEKKGIQFTANFKQTSTINLKEHIALCFYLDNPDLRELALDLVLLDSDGVVMNIGKCEYQMSKNNVTSTLDSLPLCSFQKVQLGRVQVNIELSRLKDLPRILPPLRIIDSLTSIPPAFNVNFKKKKYQLSLPSGFDLIVRELSIYIGDFSKFEQDLKRNNPFQNYYQNDIQFQISDFICDLGYHNAWKFIEQSEQALQKISFKLVSDKTGRLKLRDVPLLRRHYDSEGQLLLTLLCNVSYNIKSSISGQKAVNKTFHLGWFPIVPDLAHENTYVNEYLVNDTQFPGRPIVIRTQSKLSLTLAHKIQQSALKKRINQDRELRQYDRLIVNSKMELLRKQIQEQEQQKVRFNTKKYQSHYEKLAGESIQSSENEQNLNNQILHCLDMLEQKLVKNKVKPKGTPLVVPPSINPKSHQFDIKTVVNKTVHLSLLIRSILPHTDCPSKYYIPQKFYGSLYIAREQIKFHSELQKQSATYGIPINLKKPKQIVVRVKVEDERQILQLFMSNFCVILYDSQNNQIYAIGTANASSVFMGDSSSTRIPLNTVEGFDFGSLVVDHRMSTKNINNKQIEEIKTESIVRTLPMKERIHMRIQNFQNSQKQKSNPNQAMQTNNAINLYRQRKHMDFVNKVISQQYQNEATIKYELGIPAYLFIPFTNNDMSLNDTFTISINSAYAEIVTDLQQFNRVADLHNIPNLKVPKIQFKLGDDGRNQGYYETVISSQQKINLLFKYSTNDWSFGKLMPSNMIISLRRNTILVKQCKVKLQFKQPLISHAYVTQELVPTDKNSVVINLPKDLTDNSKHIVPFFRGTRFNSSQDTIELKLENQKRSFDIVLGLYDDPKSSFMKGYALLRVDLYEGQLLKLSLGEVFRYTIPVKEIHTQKQLVKVQSSDDDIVCPVKKVSILTQWFSPSVFVHCLTPTFGTAKKVLVSLIDPQQEKTIQQILVKVICQLKTKPQLIHVKNHGGFSAHFDYFNRFGATIQIKVISSSEDIGINPNNAVVKSQTSKKFQLTIQNKLFREAYVIVYDDNENVVGTYQLEFVLESATER